VGLRPYEQIKPSFVIDGIAYYFPSLMSNNVSTVRPIFDFVHDGNGGDLDSAIMPCSKEVDEEHWLDAGEVVYTDGTELDDFYFPEDLDK
jgi:hypothetical protein